MMISLSKDMHIRTAIVSYISVHHYNISCKLNTAALEKPQILFQSPKTIIIPDLLKAVPLVCIPNVLDKDCQYQWKCITQSTKKYSSAPILYVNENGIYHCTVKTDGEGKIGSHYMEVVLQPYSGM